VGTKENFYEYMETSKNFDIEIEENSMRFASPAPKKCTSSLHYKKSIYDKEELRNLNIHSVKEIDKMKYSEMLSEDSNSMVPLQEEDFTDSYKKLYNHS